MVVCQTPMVKSSLVACLVLASAFLLLDQRTGASSRGEFQEAQAQLDALGRLTDEIAKEVETLRGWSFKQPIARQIATPEQVRAYIDRNLETSLPAGQIPIVEAMLRTIGLIPPTCDLKGTFLSIMENQVGGYYDPETRTMNLVQRPGTMPAIVERMMLAHELTHALDDQYVDLRSLMKRSGTETEDSDFVVESVTEGSATGLMLQYMVRAQMAGRVNVSELGDYARQEAERSKPFLEAPRYFSSILGAYLCGMQFLAKGNLMSLLTAPDNRAIGENLVAARTSLPRSSEQILHPAKYWDPAQRDEPVLVDDAAVERWLARPDRWTVRRDTFGELLIAILTTPRDKLPDLTSMQTADAWTTPAAAGWGGDRFYLLASGASAADAARSLKNLKGVWVTVWDTHADREEFVTALAAAGMPAGTQIAPAGDTTAVVFVGFDATEYAALMKRLPAALTLKAPRAGTGLLPSS